jgi:hypothetical protein
MFVLAFFYIAGIFITITAVHEYTHQSDFSQVKNNITEDGICALILPSDSKDVLGWITGPGGYYAFHYPIIYEAEMKELGFKSEVKAYSISALLSLILIYPLAWLLAYINRMEALNNFI